MVEREKWRKRKTGKTQKGQKCKRKEGKKARSGAEKKGIRREEEQVVREA